MRSGARRTGTALLVSAFFSALVILGSAHFANADNLVKNVSSITMDAGTTSNALKMRIISNTAQSRAGDDQDGCNASDGTPAKVFLSISPAEGLTAPPNPIIINHCGNPATTVPLTGVIGGTYQITATVEDDGSSPPDDPDYGVYHLEPFGTVTVVVVDTTPPQTSIDSGPANPTSSQTAVFEFSASEPSTFECSRDGITYEECTSPKTYNDLAVGTYTFYVKATDLSGNTDPTPATYSWEVKALTIAITSVTPSPTIWGTPVQVMGTADVVDLAEPTVTVDWGDGTIEQDLTIAGGSWGAVSHSYSTTGNFMIIAKLMDGDTEKASSSAAVKINKHETQLTFAMPQFVTGNTKFLASGVLTDVSAGNAGISGRSIDFDGSGAPADVTTAGVIFEGEMTLASCEISGGPCSPDDLGADPDASDNVVLHLGEGGKITFPSSTSQTIVYLQDMGTTAFKYKVVEYPNTVQDCDLDSVGIQEECSSAGTEKPFIAKIDAVSGFVAVDGLKSYNGLKEIIITDVSGDSIGIAAVLTRSVDTDPKDQHIINFEDLDAPSSPSSPLTINPGAYHAIGVAQELPAADLSMDAQFEGDSLYKPSPTVSVFYNVQANLNGLGNSVTVSGSGTSVTEYSCTGLSDFDKDGICDEFESNGEILIDALSPSVAWQFPAGDLPDPTKPDVYYEIDCMNGFCPTQTELTYIEGRFNDHGIKMHLMLDQTDLAVCDPLHVWSDGDANNCNDFRSIKNNNYGTAAEKAGGTLGSGNVELILKSQAVRYLLYVKNINTGTKTTPGPTGIAEFQGNDAVVSRAGLTTDVSQTRVGSTMHEVGHNLGLLHGGKDDANCKPNYISVMNYNRQVPHTKMPVPAVNAATGVGWYGDYSVEDVLLRTSGGAVIGDGKTITEGDLDDGNKLTITANKWEAYDGVTKITSFRIMWGTPQLNTKVQTANTGTQINWDKDANASEANQSIDTNYMTVTVGTKQLPACTQATQITTLQSGGDDYATMKAAIAKFNGASTALLGIEASAPNPDEIPETNVEVINALNSLDYQFGGVANPLTNAGFGEAGIAESKKGNTIHVRFNFFDSVGTQITNNTGDNVNSYHIKKIVMRVAPVTSSEPPEDDAYEPPQTSTQQGSADFFTWDGSKWGFQMGTKNLSLTTYAARIYVIQESGEEVVLDHNGDGISFLFKLVKN